MITPHFSDASPPVAGDHASLLRCLTSRKRSAHSPCRDSLCAMSSHSLRSITGLSLLSHSTLNHPLAICHSYSFELRSSLDQVCPPLCKHSSFVPCSSCRLLRSAGATGFMIDVGVCQSLITQSSSCPNYKTSELHGNLIMHRYLNCI